MEKKYDIVIIGGGPAGMTAAIYSQRAGMKCVILEKMAVGGQVALTPRIENYPGFKVIDGMSLSQNMMEQTIGLGADIDYVEAFDVDFSGKMKKVKTKDVTYVAHAVILAMGASARALGTKDDARFVGKGLSYCAICDGAFFKDKVVAVVGGGNSAFQDIEYLSTFAKKIIHINRRSEFRADNANLETYNKLKNQKNSKIESYLGYVIEGLKGDNVLKGLVLRNLKTNELIEVETDGLFVAIGRVPQTEILDKGLKLDETGYVAVDENMKTNLDGIFACGDITHKTLRQIATATGDGAIAGISASSYVKNVRGV